MARTRDTLPKRQTQGKLATPAESKERNTRQRDAIRDAIAQAGVPISPKEILEAAQSSVQGLGLATVYRTLKLLVESGIVHPVDIPGEGPRFELSGKGHHHHFYCRGCTKVFEVDGCPGNFAQYTPPKFRLEGHELILFGMCDVCEGDSSKASAPKIGESCGLACKSGCGHQRGKAKGEAQEMRTSRKSGRG